jgi:tetratricopeptide (TPR) repeat protein
MIRRVPSWICAKAQVFYAVFVNMLKWFWRGFPALVAPLYKVLKWILIGAAGALVFGLFIDYVTGGFSLPLWWEVVVKSTVQYRIPIALALGLFFVLFLFAWVGYRRKEIQKRLRDAFRLYKPTKELILEDLGFREINSQEPQHAEAHEEERPFFGTYFSRKASEESESTNVDLTLVHEYTEEELKQLLLGNKGFLLVGLPYSGKTITLFQVLRRMKGYVVVSPNDSQPVPDEDIFALLKRQKVVIVLDDIATYAERNYDIETFSIRMKTATEGCYGVVGTCREAGDITMVVTSHGNHVTNYCESLLKLRLYPMTKAQIVALAQTTGMTLDLAEARLYPQPGNITMRDRTRVMQERFHALTEPGKDTLRAMKLLDVGGVSLTIPRIQCTLTDVFRRGIKQDELEIIIKGLWDQFFLLEQSSKERVRPHFGYLTYAVSYQEGPDLENDYLNILAQALEKAKDVEALLQVASSHRRRGDLLGSVQAIDSVLRIEPQHAYAHFHRGYSLARLGKLEEALKANKRALDIKPSAEAYNNRGYILSLLGNFSDALNALNSALDLRSDFDDAHTNRAIVLARLGRFSEAMEEFKDALGIHPENYYAYLNLGITLSRQDSFKASLEAFEQALRVRPDYPEAYLNRGITFARMHKLEDALKAHDHAIELRHDYAQAYMQRGQTLANLKRYPEALESLIRAIELQPDYAVAYGNRARTFAHMGPKYQEAASKDWQTALDLGLVLPQTDLTLGVSLAHSGAFKEAITVFDSFIDSYPESADAYYQRGRTLATSNRYDAALLDFDKSIKLRPNHSKALCDRGAALANLVGRYDEALEASKIALELYPEFAPAYFNRGYVLTRGTGYNRARIEQALQAYNEAVRIRPNYPEAHRERGFVLGQLGFDEEALNAFDQAIELRPEYAEALFGKARSLCFLARRNLQPFPTKECFEKAIVLLEHATTIDTSIIARIAKDHSAFRELRRDLDYGPRLNALVWGSAGNKDDPKTSTAPS